MKLTKQSKLLMSYFENNNCIDRKNLTKKTQRILTGLYNDLVEANYKLDELKLAPLKHAFDLQILKITDKAQIFKLIKSEHVDSDYFPAQIKTHIDTTASHTLIFKFKSFSRVITVVLTVEDNDAQVRSNLILYERYVEHIYLWIHMLHKHAPCECSEELTISIFLTSFDKQLPSSSHEIVGVNNVNTAFTTSCEKKTEIIIYRKEEWFKVFVHETFHSFGLDFSSMNNDSCVSRIIKLFPVKSDVKLFEAYAEFWAETINVMFCSFNRLANNPRTNNPRTNNPRTNNPRTNNPRTNNNDDLHYFLLNFNDLMQLELNHSLFQLVKTLRFMGLTYDQLLRKRTVKSMHHLYKERSNVLSYYVIKTVLLINYQQFLLWCDTRNDSLLRFKPTVENQSELCNFIEKYYIDKHLLSGVECAEFVLDKATDTFLTNNLRMSLCELG